MFQRPPPIKGPFRQSGPLVVFCVYLLLTASIRHYFPRPGAHNWTAAGAAHRESHPSEDLSELPPLLESVAGQGYHCRRTGSWRGLPKPVRFEWVVRSLP